MAWFHKGFTFERGATGCLMIEGNPVDLRDDDDDELERQARAHIDVELTDVWKKRNSQRKKHLAIARAGREEWNQWRRTHPEIIPMLADHNFSRDDADLCLDDYDFSYANFTQATLDQMSVKRANFHQAILAKAEFRGAHLEGANFCRTDLYETDFQGAFLSDANLQGVQLAKTNLKGAQLQRCRVYGLSAWDLALDGANQDGLRIDFEELVDGKPTRRHASVAGLDVASFMYYTYLNSNIDQIITSTKSQWVLLLGRFTEGHKHVLDELADRLRERRYIPITFDFESRSADVIETIVLLAGLSGLIIVDITDPSSAPLELYAIVPHFAVTVVPIIKEGHAPFAVFRGLGKFPWMRPAIEYNDSGELEAKLDDVLQSAGLSRYWTSRRTVRPSS